MGSDWATVTLNDVLETIVDYRGKTPPKSNTGIPVLTAASVKNGRVMKDKISFISQETYEKVTTRGFPQVGDVLITTEAPCGEVAPFPDDKTYHITRRIMALRGKPEVIDSKFLLYTLMSTGCQQQIYARVRGTTVPRVLKTDITGLTFKLPSLNEQSRISHFIGSIDTKIELNRKTNQTLEQMAQTLFKSWFVDFDPVFDNALLKAGVTTQEPYNNAGDQQLLASFPEALRPKAKQRLDVLHSRTSTHEGTQEPHSNEEQVHDCITTQERGNEAFPSEFEFNDQLGWIPKGWELAVSGELIDVRDGTHDSPKESDVGFPLVTSRHITTGILDLSKTYLISESDYAKVNARSKVDHGDILLTMIGTVGIPYLVIDNPVNFAIKNIGLFKTSSSVNLKNYFYLLLKSPMMQRYLESRMAGTTQKYLSLKALRNISFLLPENCILDHFDNVINELTSKSKANLIQIKSLTKLRDTLLPKLISGELQIPDTKLSASSYPSNA